MITKEHIREYLNRLSSGIPPEQDQMSAHVWQEFQEYLVNHYGRLDKETRAYADSIFDQLESSVEKRISSLPEGREKETLNRKLSMVRAERPPVPVLYLDTPVIEDVIRHALGERLPKPLAARSKSLWKETKTLIKDGKLICPEDSFHREALQMGSAQSREGLNIMRTVSGGLSFKHCQSIEDFQIFRALRGFINGNGPVNYRKFWPDAFEEETVSAILKRHPSVAFTDPLSLSEKPGAAVTRQVGSGFIFTHLKIRSNASSLKNASQMQKRSTRHLRDLARLGMRYRNIMAEVEKRRLDGFWAGQKIDLSLALWKHFGGQPDDLEGLVSFFESNHFENVPAIRIKQDIWNAFAIYRTAGLKRGVGHADVNTLSAVLPYTDIMVLGPTMTDVIRDRLGLDSKFDTAIYSKDEHDLIIGALKEMTCAE